MNSRQIRTLAGVAVIAVALMAVSACSGAASAQAPATPGPRTIAVTGTGSAYGAPDIAHVQLGVQTRGADPGQAVNDNNARMEALIAAIQGMGIAEQDMQTTNFSVYVQQDYDPQTGRPLENTNYVVDNTLNVTVRDPDLLGDVLSGAVDAGANSIHGVSFSVEDVAALQAEARAKAVADARARAEQLAQSTGVTLDTVMTVSENVYADQPIVFGRDMAQAAVGGAVPVQTGQVQVNLQVTLVYTIK
ncbi:MAG: SIMPL domain-containing protein [Anaerolineales bacterium]|nr:SIMPL domain-containing protein [Anaerolineales bacterium]